VTTVTKAVRKTARIIFFLSACNILKRVVDITAIIKAKKIMMPVRPDNLWIDAMIISESHSWAVHGREGDRYEKMSFLGTDKEPKIYSPARM
jgi:hypothetical protein